MSRNHDRDDVDYVRRKVLGMLAATPALALTLRGSVGLLHASTLPALGELQPTPPCDDGDDDPTPAQTEGPYFTSSSPERASLLEAGMKGSLLTLSGLVLSTSCEPIPRAKLDFWQADDGGIYDNVGYRLRGHQFADDKGRFTLQTVVPGLYPGRTRHIHVKAQAPGKPVLTTQLYFPDEPQNARDRIFSPKLLMHVQESSGGRTAAFNFILRV